MNDLLKKHYDTLGPQVVEALKKRQFDAYYSSTGEEALEKALELIPVTDTIGWGGSITLDALGIKEKLRERGNVLFDRDHCPKEEVLEMRQKGANADTFLTSSNAITEDGQLFNIDGTGNRVAALCFGPNNVIVIAGMNKVVKTLEDAKARVKLVAAPANANRLNCKTPCAATGMCADCKSPASICCSEVTSRISRPTGRIKVILIGEDYGL